MLVATLPAKDVRGKRETMTITVHVPDSLLEDLRVRRTPSEILRVAAIHLYSRGLVSQGKGAEIAGLSRWEFIQALGRAEVPACQVTSEELKEEVQRAYPRIVNASPLILLTKVGRIDLFGRRRRCRRSDARAPGGLDPTLVTRLSERS